MSAFTGVDRNGLPGHSLCGTHGVESETGCLSCVSIRQRQLQDRRGKNLWLVWFDRCWMIVGILLVLLVLVLGAHGIWQYMGDGENRRSVLGVTGIILGISALSALSLVVIKPKRGSR